MGIDRFDRASSPGYSRFWFSLGPIPSRASDGRTVTSRRRPSTMRIIEKNHRSKANTASLLVQNLSLFVIAFLKKNKGSKNKAQALKNTAQKVLDSLFLHHARRSHKRGNRNLLGAGFAFSGRAYGAKKAASFCLLRGSAPLNTLEANIDFSSIMQKTRNGT
jgi:hypothetical protein